MNWFRIMQNGKRIGFVQADNSEQAVVLWQQSAGKQHVTAEQCYRPQFYAW